MATTKENQNKVNNSLSGVLFLIIGLALGFVIGFMITNSLNEQPASATAKPGAVKGNEKLPEGHPTVSQAEIEEQVKVATEYGQKNQDYDSQMRVANYLYMEVQRPETAKPFFLKAHEQKPEEYEPLMQLGNICYDTGRDKKDEKLMQEAVQWYEKALKIKPNDVNLHTDLGSTYMFREPPDYNTALSHYEKALAIEPKYGPTLYNKVRALIGLKNLKAAEETFELFKQVSPQQEPVNELRAELDKAKGGADSSVKIPTH
ncbi:MAG: tetratricopeptide repeat protein [Acidobacteriota bacterium]